MLPSALDMAVKLDGMERSVDSYTAQFLSDNLPRLRKGESLTDGQFRFLIQTYKKYFDADGEPLYSPSDQEYDGDY